MPSPFTGIGVAPRLLSATSINPTLVRAQFNEALDEATVIGPTSYILTPDGGSTARNVVSAFLFDADSVNLTLDGPLTAGVDNYLLHVDDVTDVAGNVIDPAYDEVDFGGIFVAVPAIASHCVLAQARLIAQFSTKQRILDLVCALANPSQAIEQAGADVLAYRSIATAYGETLDLIGATLRQEREGFDDGSYRQVLLAQSLALSCQGRPNQLINVLFELDAGFSTPDVRLVENFPAHYALHCLVPAGGELIGERWARILAQAKPAGVGYYLEFEEDGIALFSWSVNAPDGDSDPGNGTGWEYNLTEGDTDASTGGTWSEATSGDNSLA